MSATDAHRWRSRPPSGRQGAADTRFLNKYANTPTVIFGPGSTAIMHANDEYVSIDDYMTSIKVMALSIFDWCNAEPVAAKK